MGSQEATEEQRLRVRGRRSLPPSLQGRGREEAQREPATCPQLTHAHTTLGAGTHSTSGTAWADRTVHETQAHPHGALSAEGDNKQLKTVTRP